MKIDEEKINKNEYLEAIKNKCNCGQFMLFFSSAEIRIELHSVNIVIVIVNF